MRLLPLVVFALCGCVGKPTKAPPVTPPRAVPYRIVGYLHRASEPVTVRVVLHSTVRPAAGRAIDWSHDGVGWSARVVPDVPLIHPIHLIPLSVYEYEVLAKRDHSWPHYRLPGSTTVFRKSEETGAWSTVAESPERYFTWSEQFVLRDGDVIAVRQIERE
jgi:hypothetical protein